MDRPARSYPNGNRALHREGIYAGVSYMVPFAREADHILGPEGPQHRDLLFAASPSVVEILAQGLVLHRVPAQAYTQPKPPSA